jgi:hypothetical protein
MTPYQTQASILKPFMPKKEEIEKINTFFFCRWLSNNRFTVPIAGILNKYYNIPIYVQYIFANDYVELVQMRNKVKFIGIQKEYRSVNEDILKNIKRYYKINDEEAQEYCKLMNEKEKNRFLNMYNEGMIK